jgi:competence protein ComEC
MLAMPATSLLVMPMALLALIAMPFGLEAWPLALMGLGIELMLAVAAFVAGLPGAVIAVPAFGLPVLLLMVSGGLWLILWRGGWRYWGLVPIAGGLALAPFGAHPDIWVDRDGHVIAVRGRDGRLTAPKTRKGEFSLRAWLESDGDARAPREAAKGEGFQCDEHSCLALVRGRLVSHVTHPAALADDCRRAAVLISPLPVLGDCPAPAVVIDARDLWENGAHTIRFGERLLLRKVTQSRGVRPWVAIRRRRDVIPPTAPEPKRDGEGAAETAEFSGAENADGVAR